MDDDITRYATRPRQGHAGRLVHTCNVCGEVDKPVIHATSNPGHEITSDRVRN